MTNGRRQRGVPRSLTLRVWNGPTGATTTEHRRPLLRGECVGDGWNAGRPCPFVGCRYALYLEALPTGNIKLNFPALEPWEMEHSCALDEAELGGLTLEEVGRRTNLTRERMRQVEYKALLKMKWTSEMSEEVPA